MPQFFRKKKLSKKTVKQISDIKCNKCNKTINNEAVLKAEEKVKKKIEAHIKKYNTINIKVEWEISCNHCGNKFNYLPKED